MNNNMGNDVSGIVSQLDNCITILEDDNVWNGVSRDQLLNDMREVDTDYLVKIVEQTDLFSDVLKKYQDYTEKCKNLEILQGLIQDDSLDEGTRSDYDAQIVELTKEIEELKKIIKDKLEYIKGLKIGDAIAGGNVNSVINGENSNNQDNSDNVANESNSGMQTYGKYNLVLPIEGAFDNISSGIGERKDPFGSGNVEIHGGVDISRPAGTAIHAVQDGVVVWAESYHYDKYKHKNTSLNTYGKVVVIQHDSDNGERFYTLYAHMSDYDVAKGDIVSQGDVIGAVGSTGRSTAAHLHFEVRENINGNSEFGWRNITTTKNPNDYYV